jgi:hypothetical protein
MTDAKAGVSLETDRSAALEARLAAAGELLARARRALAAGELPELERLFAVLEGLPGELGRIPKGDDHLRGRLLALLDDAGGLTETLRQEHARLAAQLRVAGVYRRAGAAYWRASKL